MTLPLTMDCLENNLKKNPRIIRFLCPIGATVNMDGFALYESMVVIFFAQLRGMNLGVGEVLTVAWVIFTFSNAFPLLNWSVARNNARGRHAKMKKYHSTNLMLHPRSSSSSPLALTSTQLSGVFAG